MRSTLASKILFAILLLVSPAAHADQYEFDKEHTHIAFYVNHLGLSDMLGLFKSYDGNFKFDEKHPEQSTIDITLKPSGIETSSKLLDHVLQGDNFFNTDKFPDIHFVSTSLKVTGDNTGDLTGDLTMLGVTKPLTLHVHYNKSAYSPVTNMYSSGFTADTTLKRSDFGMSYGIPMVGDEVRVEISTEGLDLDRKKAESLKH